MPAVARCPNCQRSSAVPDGSAGKVATCPACKQRFQISSDPNNPEGIFIGELTPVAPPRPQAIPAPRQDPPSKRAAPAYLPGTRLSRINEELPYEMQDELRKGEIAYYFAFTPLRHGGCGSTRTDEGWILATNERVSYEGTVITKDGNRNLFVRKSGSIPLSKISFVGTASISQSDGCNSIRLSTLEVSSGGGTIALGMPYGDEAFRAQEAIEDILRAHGHA